MERTKNIDKPYLILISGIPNTGKSTTAIKLASKLGFSTCLGTDEIKALMRFYDSDFFINQDSHSCWSHYGNYCNKTFLTGYKKHCQAIGPGIAAIIKQAGNMGRSVIIEGVHLWPEENYDKNNNFKIFHFIIIQDKPAMWRRNIKQKLDVYGSKQENVWQKHQEKYFYVQEKLKNISNLNKKLILLKNLTPAQNVNKILAQL